MANSDWISLAALIVSVASAFAAFLSWRSAQKVAKIEEERDRLRSELKVAITSWDDDGDGPNAMRHIVVTAKPAEDGTGYTIKSISVKKPRVAILYIQNDAFQGGGPHTLSTELFVEKEERLTMNIQLLDVTSPGKIVFSGEKHDRNRTPFQISVHMPRFTC